VLILLHIGVDSAQHPLLDMAANRVIQKYQTSTCEQLWQQKSQPKSDEEQNFIQLLRSDPQLRMEFINRVAVPISRLSHWEKGKLKNKISSPVRGLNFADNCPSYHR